MNTGDRQKIRQIAEEWVPALQSGDVARNLALFTDDVVIAGGDSNRILVGPGEVRKIFEEIFSGYRATQCSLAVQDLEIHGDWAELRAVFKAVWEPRQEGVEPEREYSNYIWVLKRQPDDSWKIGRFLFYPSD